MYSDGVTSMSGLPAHRGHVQAKEVWAWNFDLEFCRMMQAVSMAQGICVGASVEENTCKGVEVGRGFNRESVGGGTMISVDTEFPGFARDMPRQGSREAQYKALRDSVDVLQPIQLGLAVAVNGSVVGAWNFNMRFDLAEDLHTQEAVVVLSAAGVDFQRHAAEGVDAVVLGRSLANSPFVCFHGDASGQSATRCSPVEPPHWVTFAGFYDLGYLVKLLTNERLPSDACGFDAALAKLCPRRCELGDYLPSGSFQSMLDMYSVERCSMAETRGSDALAMLELCVRAVLGVTPIQVARWSWEELLSTYVSADTTASVESPQTTLSSGGASECSITTASTMTASTTTPTSIASVTPLVVDVQAERDEQPENDGPFALGGVSARACMGAPSAKVQPAARRGCEGLRDNPTQHLAAEASMTTLRRKVGKRRGRETLHLPSESTAGVAMWAAKARERARVAASTGNAKSGDGARGRSGQMQHSICAESLNKKQVEASIGGHFCGEKVEIANVAAAVFRPPPGLSLSHFAPAVAA